MAIDLENHLGRLLQDPMLPQTERGYLEKLRAENSRFLEEHRNLYPNSPYDYGELHIKSMADVRIGTPYELYRSQGEDKPFLQEAKLVVKQIIREWGPSAPAHGPFTLSIEIIYEGNETSFHARKAAWQLGLEPIPQRTLPALAWDPDVYLARIKPN